MDPSNDKQEFVFAFGEAKGKEKYGRYKELEGQTWSNPPISYETREKMYEAEDKCREIELQRHPYGRGITLDDEIKYRQLKNLSQEYREQQEKSESIQEELSEIRNAIERSRKSRHSTRPIL